MKNVLLVLVGLFAGLWLSERQKKEGLEQKLYTATSTVDKSRTLEQLSPTYAGNLHPLKELSAVSSDNLHTYATGIAHELIRPDLTELEAKNAAEYVGKTILAATMYYDRRKRTQDQKSESWLNDAMEETFDDDADQR